MISNASIWLISSARCNLLLSNCCCVKKDKYEICNCFIWIKWCAPNPRDFKSYPSVPGTLVLEVDPCIAWQLKYCNSSYLVIQYRPTTATLQPLQILTTLSSQLNVTSRSERIDFLEYCFALLVGTELIDERISRIQDYTTLSKSIWILSVK